MYQRLEDGATVSAAEALASAALGARARRTTRPYTFFNFVTTLDGRAALDGSTRPLGGPADLEMLLSLRAVADAVLIGPGTVRAEGYGRLVGPDRRASPPPAVLISRRFDIPWEAGLFAAADQPVLVYTSLDARFRRLTSRRRSRSSGWRSARRRRRWPTCARAASARC